MKNGLKFFLKEKVKNKVPVEVGRHFGSPAPFGCQEICCILTTIACLITTAHLAKSKDDLGNGIGASFGVAVASTALFCCLLPCVLGLAFKTSAVDMKMLETELKAALKDALKNTEYTLTDAEFKKYFKIAQKNLSNEDILKDFDNLLNQEAMTKLVNKISQQLLTEKPTEEKPTEETSLIGSVQNV